MIIYSDLEKLLQVFPDPIKESLKKTRDKSRLLEIIVDLGRRPEGRFSFKSVYLSEQVVSWQDLEYTTKRLGAFSNENRAGIEQSLHRISCIRNRQGMIIGLSCRIGRCVLGSIDIFRDLLDSDHSLLLLGKPGVGKTTFIREISRILSDEIQKRVVIIDTANEIAGDGDIPHPGIGRARRMQVARTDSQHDRMIEAIENHMPEVIVVDEIGTERETLAARTIAERGVKLVGTVHGNSLENLIKNPTLSDLIGGIQYVTLSDEEARRRGTQKTVLERKFLPAFPIAIELKETKIWTIHEKVEDSIDRFLQGQESKAQNRRITNEGRMQINASFFGRPPMTGSRRLSQNYPKDLSNNKGLTATARRAREVRGKGITGPRFAQIKGTPRRPKNVWIYVSSLSFKKQTKVYKSLEEIFVFTKTLEGANLVLISKAALRQNQELQEQIKEKGLPVFLFTKKVNLQKMIKEILRRTIEKNI